MIAAILVSLVGVAGIALLLGWNDVPPSVANVAVGVVALAALMVGAVLFVDSQ